MLSRCLVCIFDSVVALGCSIGMYILLYLGLLNDVRSLCLVVFWFRALQFEFEKIFSLLDLIRVTSAGLPSVCVHAWTWLIGSIQSYSSLMPVSASFCTVWFPTNIMNHRILRKMSSAVELQPSNLTFIFGGVFEFVVNDCTYLQHRCSLSFSTSFVVNDNPNALVILSMTSFVHR